jgi:hypothetical protein
MKIYVIYKIFSKLQIFHHHNNQNSKKEKRNIQVKT